MLISAGKKAEGRQGCERERWNANGNEPNNQRLTKRGRSSCASERAKERDGGRGREEIKYRKHSDLTPANSILHVLPAALHENGERKVGRGTKGMRDETVDWA